MILPTYPFSKSSMRERLGFKTLASRPNFTPLRTVWGPVPSSGHDLPVAPPVDPVRIDFERCERESRKEITMEVASERTRSILASFSQIEAVVGKSLPLVKSIAKHADQHRRDARRRRKLLKDEMLNILQSDASSIAVNASIRAELHSVVSKVSKDILAEVTDAADAACSQKTTSLSLSFDSMEKNVQNKISDALRRVSHTAVVSECAIESEAKEKPSLPCTDNGSCLLEGAIDAAAETSHSDFDDVNFDDAPLGNLSE